MRYSWQKAQSLTDRSRWLVWLCAVTLIASQLLVALHGVVHRVAVDTAQAPHVATVQTDGPAGSFFGLLFVDHESIDDCQAFDQLNHADKAIGAEPTALPLALFAFQIALFSGLAAARWHAQFEARGPPASR